MKYIINKFKATEGWNWPLIVTGLLLLGAVILPLTWFVGDQMLLRGDPMFVFDPARYWQTLWQVWHGKINLGYGDELPPAMLIHYALPALLAAFGASDQVAEKLHFIIWFALPGLSIALFINLLARQLKVSQWAVPIAVSFYLFNLYRLAIFGDNNHFEVYAATPLALYFLTKALATDRHWLPGALSLALTTLIVTRAGTNPPMYLMFWIPVALYGLVLTLANYRAWRRWLPVWLVFGGVTLILNLFWLVPFYQILRQSTNLSTAGKLDWLADLSKHTSLARVTRLMGAWDWFDQWQGEPYAPYAAIYQRPLWSVLTLLPILLTPWLFLFRKSWNRYLLPLLLLGLIGLIFSQGLHPPFGPIFYWAAHHLPFFWVFRSPWYKFTNLTALSIAALAALSIGMIVDRLATTRFRLMSLPLIIIGLVLPMIIAHPFITGSRWLKPDQVSNLAPDTVPYPKHIRQAADWLNQQPGDGAVGLLPYQGAAIFDWGLQTPVDPITYMSRRPVFFRGDRIGDIIGNTPGASVAYRVFVERLYSDDPQAEAVAKLLGLEYLIIRKDIRYSFYNDHDGPDFLAERLAKQPNLKPVQSFGQWDIYHFQTVKAQPVYATNWTVRFAGHPLDSFASILAESVAGNQFPAIFYDRPITQPDPQAVAAIEAELAARRPAPALTVKQADSNYSITGQADQPFLLVLNQSWSPNWQAASRNAELGQPVVVNGYAPAWLVKPKGQFTLKISYRPQRWVEPLAGLTIITTLLCLLVIWRFKKVVR